MKILVAGGAGYIGSHTVYELIDNGADVVIIDSLETGHIEAVHPKARFYQGDIRDRAFLDDVLTIEKNIDGRSNNYIDVSNIHLDEDEKITEVKIVFGDVKKDFSSIEKPHIIMMVNDGVQDDTEIKNHTILEAYNKEYKACNEDDAISIVYNIKKEKKLPRTGY